MWLCAAAALVVACAKSTPPPAEPTGPPGQPAIPEDQVAMGGKLYGQYCAKCHGAAGEGTDKAPPVVGPSALPEKPRPGSKRGADFKTALDVALFVKKAMPGDDPGSLTDDQYFAILAFDLKANGVDVTGKRIDASSSGAIKLH